MKKLIFQCLLYCLLNSTVVAETDIFTWARSYCNSGSVDHCGLEPIGSFDNGKIAGIQECQKNPSSCNITDTNGSTEEGIKSCQSNPVSCSLESSGSFEKGKVEGRTIAIQECQSNPSSCNITDTNGSTAEGIALCQSNPVSCNLENTGAFNNGKTIGVQQCQKDPSSCQIALPVLTLGTDELLNGLQLAVSEQFLTLPQALATNIAPSYKYLLKLRPRTKNSEPFVFDLTTIITTP